MCFAPFVAVLLALAALLALSVVSIPSCDVVAVHKRKAEKAALLVIVFSRLYAHSHLLARSYPAHSAETDELFSSRGFFAATPSTAVHWP